MKAATVSAPSRRDWTSTRYFLEHLPHAEPGWGYVFVKQWSESGDPAEIDRWLAERAEANPGYWLREQPGDVILCGS
jgi:hypothetical protein